LLKNEEIAQVHAAAAARGCRCLATVLLYFGSLSLAWASGTTSPALLWEAPQGIDASAAAAHWLTELAREVGAAKTRCPNAALPTLDPEVPSKAFRVTIAPTRPVIYSKDTLVDYLLVMTTDGRGCPWHAASGRIRPFDDRWLLSPLVNIHLPTGLPPQEATVVIQDRKTIRPWIRGSPEPDFVRGTMRLWVLIGIYTGVLTVLLFVGLGLRRSYPSPVTDAYCFYMFTLIVYELQTLGVGPAWIPGWPQGEAFRLMQAAAAAAVVVGVGTAMVAFLRPGGVLRQIIVGGVTLGALAFLGSWWYAPSYRLGALIMLLLAPAVLFMLIRGLKGNQPWVRWFAVGLGATIIGGVVQAATVVFNGAGMNALGNFAFPLGNLVDSVCWLIALLVRLRTERAQAQEQLVYDATHDALTGLPNRVALSTRMVSSLTDHRNAPTTRRDCRGLVLLDLDRFKVINASLGYAAGDNLLVAVARLLRTLAPPQATVAHLGGDAFAILLYTDDLIGDAQGVALRIMERLREPIALDGGSVHVRASMGVVCAPAADIAIIDILRDADSALNLAKIGGGNRYVNFQPVMRAPALKRFYLEQAMVEALRRHEFRVFFQPIVALADRRAVGMEALIRWQQPQHGWLPPADFIPVAEETGLIVPIGAWVLEHTAGQIEEWKRTGHWRPGYYVSVNLSGHQLLDGELLAQIDGVIARGGLLAGELRLELTETAVITNIDAASSVLPALRERHIPLYMDDFGTGYSSLGYLNELPFDVLKIDRSFITEIETRDQSQILVRTVLALAQAMGLDVVAEGIETEGQAALLHAMGCRYGQGYYFSRPVAAEQAATWLA